MDKLILNTSFASGNARYLRSTAVLLLLLIAIAGGAYAQVRKITGVVKDNNGQTLVGVTVRVEGQQVATSTDVDGKYIINVPGNQTRLVFSFIGCNTQQQLVGNRKEVNVTLAAQLSGLNEVVVIGYGTAKKKDLTGSVGQVPMADVNKAPVRSIDEALAGRVAGVQVNSSDGQPGSSVNIVIRGQTLSRRIILRFT